jgi:hypothetical protein
MQHIKNEIIKIFGKKTSILYCNNNLGEYFLFEMMICLHPDMELLIYMLKIKYVRKLQIFGTKFSCNLVYILIYFSHSKLYVPHEQILYKQYKITIFFWYNLHNLRLEKNWTWHISFIYKTLKVSKKHSGATEVFSMIQQPRITVQNKLDRDFELFFGQLNVYFKMKNIKM